MATPGTPTTPTTPNSKALSSSIGNISARKRKRTVISKANDEETAKLRLTMGKFFVPVPKTATPAAEPPAAMQIGTSRVFPFQPKEGMTLAPSHSRPPLTPDQHATLLLDEMALSEESDYVKTTSRKRLNGDLKLKGKPADPMKGKLFQFHENQRPAYYGTQRRTSTHITGRRPFSTSEGAIFYGYDSDDEWEEDPPDAENLDELGPDDVEAEDSSDDENDGFFVGHGYLSPGEGSDEEDMENMTPEQLEQRKARLAAKDAEFQEKLKLKEKREKELRAVKPVIYGPTWDEPVASSRLDPIAKEIHAGGLFDYTQVDREQEKLEKLEKELKRSKARSAAKKNAKPDSGAAADKKRSAKTGPDATPPTSVAAAADKKTTKEEPAGGADKQPQREAVVDSTPVSVSVPEGMTISKV